MPKNLISVTGVTELLSQTMFISKVGLFLVSNSAPVMLAKLSLYLV
jgi:hypothetical protein